jgi:hypothetical protein
MFCIDDGVGHPGGLHAAQAFYKKRFPQALSLMFWMRPDWLEQTSPAVGV